MRRSISILFVALVTIVVATGPADATTGGAVQWNTPLEAGDRGSAMATSPDGTTVFATGEIAGDPGTTAYDVVSGAIKWETHHSTDGTGAGDSVAVTPDGKTVL